MSKTGAENLFRRQALRCLAERHYGRPVCYVPRPWYWLGSLLLVLAVVAVAFAARAEYSRKERVRGWLVPSAGVTRISHDALALVAEVLRKAGEAVDQDDAILVVSREAWLDDGRSSTHAVLDELRSQIAAVDERVRLLRLETDIGTKAIAARLRTLAADLHAVDERIDQQRRRVEAALDRQSRLEAALGKGAVSEFDVLRQEDATLATQQEMMRLVQEKSSLSRDLQSLDESARRMPVELETEISRLREQQSRLRQQFTGHQLAQRGVIRAPVAGRIATVDVREGQSVAPGQLLATIVPESPELVAEVYVPSSAIGLLRSGQRVLLQYDAFPIHQFGTFGGRVVEISEIIVLPAEIPPVFALRQAAFRVRVELSDEAVAFESVRTGLRPGMTLGAEIIVETNTLMSWLLRPLRDRLAGSA